jgi:hypothetical protein
MMAIEVALPFVLAANHQVRIATEFQRALVSFPAPHSGPAI